MEPAIRVENLSKQYKIGRAQQRHDTLRDALVDGLKAPFEKFRNSKSEFRNSSDTIWALKDVSFEVQPGEVLGIIGRNGAGKSTLLKILSRITEPTSGRAVINGRVGSLLEVGTGFHPELTGRENIYLNGAILGMTRKEIDRKFDEIVAFAEIEKFLDTPVKRYSSGMYVRLAFAVAAHLEPEILLVDEVLAVGDATFQKKCLGKMGEVAQEGRTVLFVSHNMAAIKSLCGSAVYLDEGCLKVRGNTEVCISDYLSYTKNIENIPYIQFDKNQNLPLQLLSLNVINDRGEVRFSHPHNKPFFIQAKIAVHSPISKTYLAFHIHDRELNTIIFSRDFESNQSTLLKRERGLYTYNLKIPAPLLVPGRYSISFHIARSSPPEMIDGANHVCWFEIVDSGSAQAKTNFPWRGKVIVPIEWKYSIESFDDLE